MSQTAVQTLPARTRAAKCRVLLTGAAARAAVSVGVPAIFLFTTEWIHRGTLDQFYTKFISAHQWSFLLAWLLLTFTYVAISKLTGWHSLATGVTSVLGNLPAAVSYYKLQIRGEPFLPWDLSQISEATGVIGQANIKIQPSMLWTIFITVLLIVGTSFLREPKLKQNRRHWGIRMGIGAGSVGLLAGLVFGVYLVPAATEFFKIQPDMWMQNRYYRTHGVITGFMTNLQTLKIGKPEGYSQEAVHTLAEQVQQNKPDAPRYTGSYAAVTDEPEQQPNIIFIMDEAFWDVTELDGIAYSEPVTPNLQRLKQQAAVGRVYSPSFGGGTCDVEFEALTGFSVEHLPMGCKPFQQHVTHDMFSLPNHLKGQGYQTLAIHGYYRKYWNRDQAYPYLGIDAFIAADNFENPEKKRGFFWKGGLISEAEMGRRIISEFESRSAGDPMFIHAVTMQNHSGYNAQNYPADELVQITQAPEDISEDTLSQLQDFATGIRDADQMLGNLVSYFSNVEEPTILVFWGDHYNTVGKGYELFQKTGYIGPNTTESPKLYATPLLVWSNYHDQPVDLGTVAAHDIAPVMMELYGMEKPPMFEFLTQELSVFRARSRGVTVNPDGSTSADLTPEQEAWFQKHWLLQYDLMFGEQYLLEESA